MGAGPAPMSATCDDGASGSRTLNCSVAHANRSSSTLAVGASAPAMRSTPLPAAASLKVADTEVIRQARDESQGASTTDPSLARLIPDSSAVRPRGRALLGRHVLPPSDLADPL